MTQVSLTKEQWDKVENHIATHNSEMGVVRTNIEWLTWAVKLLIGSMIGSVSFTLIGLVIQIWKLLHP